MTARTFWRRFALGAAGLLLVNLISGFAAWMIEKRVTENAIAIYDRVLVSENYIHMAELSFRDFVADQTDARERDEHLEKTLDGLDIAIERASTPTSRAKRMEVRDALADLRLRGGEDAAELKTREAQAEQAMANLARQASAEGLIARDSIAEQARTYDWILAGLALTTVAIAAGGLFALRSLVKRIVRMANFDSLTGLPKRPLLQMRLDEQLAARQADGASFAVFSIDLDRFKAVNDTLGSRIGDALLIEVAQRITATLDADDVAARFGSDEFVILDGKNRGVEQAGVLASDLIAAISAPYTVENHRIVIGASVGIAFAPGGDDAVDDLIRNSDIALYRAKSEGKGCYRYFAEEMNQRMQRRRRIEVELRDAIESRRLEIHYQPLLELASGDVRSCEALVRWRLADGRYLPPDEFIPLAEENGLIIPLGKYVLTQACLHAKRWPRNIRVAVNISAAQFRVGDLVGLVREALMETGLAPNRLDLEVTESVLFDAQDEVIASLTKLRQMGVRVSLDDFGAGYSSLSRLADLPFHKVKIDRSFIRDVHRRKEAGAIVRAIVELANALGVRSTAEGVECDEELDWVRQAGCSEAQGYLFCRPLSVRGIEDFLNQNIDLAPARQRLRA